VTGLNDYKHSDNTTKKGQVKSYLHSCRTPVETQLQGTYANDRFSVNGSVTFSFNQGGFSSPDSTKAAQGVSGRIILKLQYAAPEQKLTFNIRSEQTDGEYLWGKFYSNLSGQKASLAADGTFF